MLSVLKHSTDKPSLIERSINISKSVPNPQLRPTDSNGRKKSAAVPGKSGAAAHLIKVTRGALSVKNSFCLLYLKRCFLELEILITAISVRYSINEFIIAFAPVGPIRPRRGNGRIGGEIKFYRGNRLVKIGILGNDELGRIDGYAGRAMFNFNDADIFGNSSFTIHSTIGVGNSITSDTPRVRLRVSFKIPGNIPNFNVTIACVTAV